MLDTTARYVYEVYRWKSVSLAARELFISQPALSAAIKRAEREWGAPIFNRKTLPLSLTPAGKVYIEAIEQMLRIEKQATTRVKNTTEIKGGTLRIGTATHLSYYVIPTILKDFHAQYPQVDIRLELTSTNNLYQLLEKESVDLIFTSTDIVPDDYTAVPLFEERMVVALPHTLPECESLKPYAVTYDEMITGTYDPTRELKDMTLLKGVEFIYNPPNTGIHKKSRMLFGQADFSPYVMSNSGSHQLNYNLMKAGFGALLTTDANLATMTPNAQCEYIILGGAQAKQGFGIVSCAEHSSVIADAFIASAVARFKNAAPLQNLQNI